jgi:predicted nucleotidyltransferase
MRYPCPCCGHLIFREPPGSYDICSICFWEDNATQLRWPSMSGGANTESLIESQRNFVDFGAVERRLVESVRPPDRDEPVEQGWRPVDLTVDNFEPLRSSLSPAPSQTGTTEYPHDLTVLYYWRRTFWRRQATLGQQTAAMSATEKAIGDAIDAVYLYGSAVSGGLRHASDIDLLVVVTRPTTRDERLDLVRELAPISNRELRPAEWRPIELTTVVIRDGQATLDFQYGEWLRNEFSAGNVEPASRAHVDLPILIAQARKASLTLRGRRARDTLPQVSRAALITAMTHGIPDLLADVETDTANVLLTLSRIWHTLATSTFAPKNVAASEFIERFADHSWPELDWARSVYLGLALGVDRPARDEAEEIVAEIRRWLQSDANVDPISRR